MDPISYAIERADVSQFITKMLKKRRHYMRKNKEDIEVTFYLGSEGKDGIIRLNGNKFSIDNLEVELDNITRFSHLFDTIKLRSNP